MSEYTTVVEWNRGDAKFTDNRYSRSHLWRFDGGIEVPGSSSPHVVPMPYSNLAAVDPEEAFVVSLSSCHMLWFLSIAATRGYVIDSYRDEAVGILAKNEAGKLAMTRVTLHPEVQFAGDAPDEATQQAMHHEAHDKCFIATSVLTEVRCEPKPVRTGVNAS